MYKYVSRFLFLIPAKKNTKKQKNPMLTTTTKKSPMKRS